MHVSQCVEFTCQRLERGRRVKTGVLLMNTGTADEPSVAAIRTYLHEFLMDPAIIGAPVRM